MKVIEVKESIFADNDAQANALRTKLHNHGVTLINIMSAPGSGKTTLLTKLIPSLQKEFRITNMDVDIESTLDADKVAQATGVPSVQIHNGGLCHIDAGMMDECIRQVDLDQIDLLFLENIGNLVCPAEFDTGAHFKMMLLSVPEGDDKPLKYPLMFQISDIVVLTKIDTLPIFPFNVETCKERILALNPNAQIFCVSAKTGEGMEELKEYISKKVKEGK